jgi:hypothetical protein
MRGEEDEISLGPHAAAIEGTEHFKGGHEVGGIVADAGRRKDIAFAADADGSAFRKNGVGVGGEDDGWAAACAFANPGNIEHVVHADVG